MKHFIFKTYEQEMAALPPDDVKNWWTDIEIVSDRTFNQLASEGYLFRPENKMAMSAQVLACPAT